MISSEAVQELATIHSARGEIYTFCSKCFLIPPCEDIYRIIDDISKKLVLLNNSENEDIKKGVSGILSFLEMRRVNKPNLADFDIEISRNFTQLFCLTSSVQTDESYYVSKDKRLCQESRDEMVSLLRKHNFKLAEYATEYEDHISIELSFMAKLSFELAELLLKGDHESYDKMVVEQKDFFTNHLNKWVSIFFDEIITFQLDNELLYKSLAKFTKGFIAEDLLFLSYNKGD